MIAFLLTVALLATAGANNLEKKWKIDVELKVEKLMTVVGKQQEKISQCESKIKILEKEIAQKYFLNYRSNSKSHKRTTRTKAENHENKELQHRSKRFLTGQGLSPIAFYAYISHSFTHVGDNQAHVYDTVVTNLGNGYSKHTGAFTVPRAGVYGFSWTVYVAGSHIPGDADTSLGEITSHLLQNGQVKGILHADTETGGEDETSTGFVVLIVNAGDVIITRASGLHQDSYYSNEYGRWTFSGFQIA
ncbi:complement C1q-like protein 4 [Saccostrea echinata]|uniref:complement C1q-like protein 4 n=1 Tax=Saccostrea echinata TaxID=191078 RepID=UPI002A80CDB0|nr:complement C1q-like protein 4 [Saccostrea echinata]